MHHVTSLEIVHLLELCTAFCRHFSFFLPPKGHVVSFPSIYGIHTGKLGVFQKVCCSCTITSGAVCIRNPPTVTLVTAQDVTLPVLAFTFDSNKHSLGFIHGHVAPETLSLLLECVLFYKSGGGRMGNQAK